ncbi:MAG: mechanosensitive ion channel [Candidatus Omnitrophica bacterium]|nr:mechanosensitive ion channel [Candidatus Omnitrophota bacterium]
MEEAITKITELGVPFVMNLIAAILIYIVGKWLAGIISTVIEKLMLKGKVDSSLAGFTKNIIKAVILIFAIIAAVGRLGVQTTSLIAIIGAAGLAIVLSLQGTLSNFAAGVMLILFKPFKVGDFIEKGEEF